MGFRRLRVINEDRVTPGAGFGTHGAPRHGDPLVRARGRARAQGLDGAGGVIRPGEVQRMSAGTGVTHSEYNASKTEPVHFLQIWIVPDARGLAPALRAEDVRRARRARTGCVLLASRDGRDGSIQVHQDAELCVTRVGAGERSGLTPSPRDATPGCRWRAAR